MREACTLSFAAADSDLRSAAADEAARDPGAAEGPEGPAFLLGLLRDGCALEEGLCRPSAAPAACAELLRRVAEAPPPPASGLEDLGAGPSDAVFARAPPAWEGQHLWELRPRRLPVELGDTRGGLKGCWRRAYGLAAGAADAEGAWPRGDGDASRLPDACWSQGRGAFPVSAFWREDRDARRMPLASQRAAAATAHRWSAAQRSAAGSLPPAKARAEDIGDLSDSESDDEEEDEEGGRGGGRGAGGGGTGQREERDDPDDPRRTGEDGDGAASGADRRAARIDERARRAFGDAPGIEEGAALPRQRALEAVEGMRREEAERRLCRFSDIMAERAALVEDCRLAFVVQRPTRRGEEARR